MHVVGWLVAGSWLPGAGSGFDFSRSLAFTCWLNQLQEGDSGRSFLAVQLSQLGPVGLLRVYLNVARTCSITTDASRRWQGTGLEIEF